MPTVQEEAFGLFGLRIPELVRIEVRLRAAGICNTFGRSATIVTPFIVVSLFQAYDASGMLAYPYWRERTKSAKLGIIASRPSQRRPVFRATHIGRIT